MTKKRKLFFNWGIADNYGWGIYGFNLLMYGQLRDKYQLVPLEDPSFFYPLDPLSIKFIAEKLIKPNADFYIDPEDIFLTGLGNKNKKLIKNACRDIGVIFSETNPLPLEEIENLKSFECIIAGSSWNAESLKRCGINTRIVIQGVDVNLFRPTPKKFLKEKFVVFSGGKLEYRKGQDILLKAFSIFASKHDDALLITSWRSSAWEKETAATINFSNICQPLIISDDVGSSIKEWILGNGVKAEQLICLDITPHRLMPEVYREVDLAVFPNRCEAGTNLVAMEALAFDLPCIISKNTGHLDIIKSDNCIPLDSQSPIDQLAGTQDWGESSVGELVDLMEEVYQGRLRVDSSRARDSMLLHSWENSINSMMDIF
jgi:glycosyltransferase involved in cell wall biosynthesis